MQKYVDVVIPMQQNSNINLLFPKSIDWEQWRNYRPDTPFSMKVVDYLNALSVEILRDKDSRLYPDLVTFAFYCRKANILNLGKTYSNNDLRLGRGILFHIAPSNVPINFGYSLITGLLSGNYNIVRISSKVFPQVDIVVKCIHKLANNISYSDVSSRIALVRYDRTSTATNYFSSLCNVRIIWGGDETIATIRKSLLPARSFDITFADRYSIAIVDAETIIADNNLNKLAEQFYNDTYLFDQNACSAPRLIVWRGNSKNIEKAKRLFWESIQKVVDSKYNFQTVLAIDKLTATYIQAVNMDINKEKVVNNNIIRVNLHELPYDIDNYRCAGGYFSEFNVKHIKDISYIIKEKYQTLAYYGFSQTELEEFICENHIKGFDRIVPIGQTTEFSLIWDGYDLINSLSRICSIK